MAEVINSIHDFNYIKDFIEHNSRLSEITLTEKENSTFYKWREYNLCLEILNPITYKLEKINIKGHA